ncbi:flavodoxin family protein [Glaciimonas immobilis]|uniref:Multimeric flavodoxin WrbA n=1 Tax=Glaciimonas immobilis TaxID=728004 RepID=A0A840RM29_9BURK|nr:flavodoxin family protein [Glaciimonas immobilis]KAF3999243.1 flavodoxin family protein [Glaciimonas immobilis]MBB5198705.1 multimeric flavodoxin WrbA [Glaciimonas immobilis]
MTEPRKGQAPPVLKRDEFHLEFRRSYMDPTFDAVKAEITKLEEVAWENYINGNKSPITTKAGPDFDVPDYDLSLEWREIRDKLIVAEATQKNSATKSRVLLICGSARNDGSCPGEISKTFRLIKLATETLEADGIEVDFLDLSLLISAYDKHIYPCKGCASTAMPLCHWPCSCYPNHGQRQTNDWMAEIYEKWVAAHAVIIMTPVYWYQAPAVLKLMIDRLVCADGGNPDPTTTLGKNAKKAKELELKGWSYPKHLAGRAYGLVVHGDVAGIEGVRRGLSDWLDWMGLLDAGTSSRLDRFIGYYESYAESHEVLDRDVAVQQEVRNVASAVANAVAKIRAGEFSPPDADLRRPRPK